MNNKTTKSKINLMALSKRELEDYFISIEEKPFRATQIIKWVHQRGVSDISEICLLYTSPSPRDRTRSRMPSSA